MKSRWTLNLILLAVVAAIVAALQYMPEKKSEQAPAIAVSSLDTSSITKVSIEVPAKREVAFEKKDGRWWMSAPLKARADATAVERVIAVLSASSVDKFDAPDLASYGLDHPALRIRFDSEEVTFGTFNPVSGMQYISYRNAVYLVESRHSEAANVQVVEMIDKNLLAPDEQIVGFDFSRLEQWEEGGGLRLAQENGHWNVTRTGAKADQAAIKQWFADSWGTLIAMSVEPYQPDHRVPYPSFEIKLKNGKTLHFDKQGESPELILARPDEGLKYHFPQDVGFEILNPPVGASK